MAWAFLSSRPYEDFVWNSTERETAHWQLFWDDAAGALAITEAGGRVTDLDGRELDFGAGLTLAKSPGLVATNGFLHEALLEALRSTTRA